MSNLQGKINALLAGSMKGQGWCTPEKGWDLAMAVIKTKAEVSVEIGVLYGSSLLPLALAHAEQDHGVVYAIDPWTREAGTDGYDGKNLEWWGSLDYENIYRTFLYNLKANGVEKYVKVLRQKSDDVEVPDKIDCLHIDGQHTDQASRDVERFAPRVGSGKFCFVDDISGWNGAPARAVERLMTFGYTKLFERGTGAMFQRTPPPVVRQKKRGRPPGKKIKKGSVRVMEA